MMYEKPKLRVAGKAADLILGIFAEGFDLDGSQVPEDTEFAHDDYLVPSCSDSLLDRRTDNNT